MTKIEPFSDESPRKLSRPDMSRMRSVRHLQQWNRPRSEDCNHYDETDQMWDVPNCLQLTRAPQQCDAHCVEKENVQGTFREPPKSKKNPGHQTRKPGRLFILPPA